ncbi:glycosyltransferase family 4 protein [Gottschalkiaceae bacterium SANA]|nr:glycosyltransferase family 4 protein [Gottschalkiaceae bacterium SANA]
MKKVLFVATVVKTHIMPFHIPYLEWFKRKGYEVHVCARNDYENREDCVIPYCDHFHEIPFSRSPFKPNNLLSYLKLKRIMDRNDYEIIHCHTPMGGVLGRLAGRKAHRRGTKMVYTAHGFHFFKGAKWINWKLYYPIEKYLAHLTDCLITINQEDYRNAVNRGFKAKKIVYVPGVGVDFNRFTWQTPDKKAGLRRQYGFEDEAFILVYAGEFTYRKHQDLLIKAANELKSQIPKLVILLAGRGQLQSEYEKMIADLGVDDQVKILGFRDDVDKLMLLADVAVSASRQEGLPVNVMEAMATALPLVVTDCRGNRDLVTDGENGYVCDIDDVDCFVTAIENLHASSDLCRQFGLQNLSRVQQYSLAVIVDSMEKVYLDCLMGQDDQGLK